MSAIPHRQSLDNEYPGAFFHPGWNYTLACGFPFETFVNIVQVMVRCQTLFFSLAQIKRYLAQEFSHTLKSRERMNKREVDSAERLLKRWHCDDDIANIKEYIELNFQAKSRLHNAKVERQNERQNKALAFIAALQVIALYGAFRDGLTLFELNQHWFAIGSAAAVLGYLPPLISW